MGLPRKASQQDVEKFIGRALALSEADAMSCGECPGCGRDRGDRAGHPDSLCGWGQTSDAATKGSAGVAT
jgi:hypothetical protein